MKYLNNIKRRLGALVTPYTTLNRWLLSRWPMVWAECYHLALGLALAFAATAAIFGFAQGATASFFSPRLIPFDIEVGLFLLPWCIIVTWCFRRAKTYESVPVVSVWHGLHYAAFDLVVLLVVLALPVPYAWGSRAGLLTHIDELKAEADDEFTLQVAWRGWLDLALGTVSEQELLEQLKARGIDTYAVANVHFQATGLGNEFTADFPGLDPNSRERQDIPPLDQIGLTSTILQPQPEGKSRTDVAFVEERAKLERVLAPLVRRYARIDPAPYMLTGRTAQLSPASIAELMVRMESVFNQFSAAHHALERYTLFQSREFVESQLWYFFPVLVTLLAIPATSVRVFWQAWAIAMTGGVVALAILFVFTELVNEGITTAIYYGMPLAASIVLLLALTRRTIAKNTPVKMLSTFVPLALIVAPFYVVSDSDDNVMNAKLLQLALLLAVGAFTRAMFNRLRALPEPY